MAVFLTLQCSQNPHPAISTPKNPLNKFPKRVKTHNTLYPTSFSLILSDKTQVGFSPVPKKNEQSLNCSTSGSGLEPEPKPEGEVDDIGVKAALSMLNFYKREISPLLPKSCRYVPTCSEYSMIAYKKYGVVKGTVLTAWRLCRCNPLGGSGFDPPRWFGEDSALEDEESEDI